MFLYICAIFSTFLSIEFCGCGIEHELTAFFSQTLLGLRFLCYKYRGENRAKRKKDPLAFLFRFFGTEVIPQIPGCSLFNNICICLKNFKGHNFSSYKTAMTSTLMTEYACNVQYDVLEYYMVDVCCWL